MKHGKNSRNWFYAWYGRPGISWKAYKLKQKKSYFLKRKETVSWSGS